MTRDRPVRPQTVGPLGAGSYASEPPYPAAVQVPAQNGKLAYTFPDTARDDFYYRSPLYIARAAKQNHTPVPTNDRWTDLLINGKNGGVMWVYPLVLDPDPNGLNPCFPNSIGVDNPGADGAGGGYNMHYGGNLRITAAGYKPSTALAQSLEPLGPGNEPARHGQRPPDHQKHAGTYGPRRTLCLGLNAGREPAVWLREARHLLGYQRRGTPIFRQ